MEQREKRFLDVCLNYVDEKEGRRLNLTYPFSKELTFYAEIDEMTNANRIGTIALRNGRLEIHTMESDFRNYFGILEEDIDFEK